MWLLISFGSLHAQIKISGNISSANGPVSFAVIELKEAAGNSKTIIQSDSTGAFVFNNLRNGNYSIAVSHIGYASYSSGFRLTQDTALVISLEKQTDQLNQVIVQGSRPIIEQSPGKVVYNLGNSITATGGDAVQAISQLPGVRVNNNEISIAGKGVTRVMINNRLVQLQGQELLRYLKSFSANQLVKIELLTNPSAQYEVEGNAGIINIITKQSKRHGYSGNVQLASKYYLYGISSMYDVKHFGEFNGSANLAYNDKRWSAYASLTHTRDEHLEGFEFNLQYPTQTWHQSDTGHYTHRLVTAIVGADYKLNKRTVIGASYSGGRDVYQGSDHVRNSIYDQNGEPDSLLTSFATYYPIALPSSLSAHAIIQLDTSGKQLSINADYFNYYRTDKSDFESNSFDGDGISKPGGRTRYFDTNKQNILVYTAKADLELPTAFANYSIGGKLSFINDYSNAFYYRKNDNDELSYDSTLSNEFDYTENTQSVYGNMSKEMMQWKFQAGLRAELTQTTGFSYTTGLKTINNYFKLYPSVLVSYSRDSNNTFSLTAGRRINRPSFWNLNPFKSLYTAHSYGEGNPYLQPEYNYNLEVSHAYKNILTTSLFANKTENGFIYVTMASADTNLVYTRPLNFINTFRYGISESIAFKPSTWWETNALLSVYHTNATSAIKEVNDISGVGAYISVQNAIYFNSSKTIGAAINFWYQFPEVDHIAQADRYYKLDLGLKMTTRNKKWDLAFNANDVFMSSALAYSYTVNNIPQKFTNFQFNRFLQFSVNYRFGSKSNSETSRSSGNEEEQARIH